jgi:hypothetical protein
VNGPCDDLVALRSRDGVEDHRVGGGGEEQREPIDRSRLNHRQSVRFLGRGRIYAGRVIETSERPGRWKWGVHEIREILKARIGA